MEEREALGVQAFLTEEEVVARYRGKVRAGTLRNWRSQGRGPPYVKVGRSILYPLVDLEAWERQRASNAKSDRRR